MFSKLRKGSMLILICVSVTLYSAADGINCKKCEAILNRYGIDIKLKSKSGWARVCYNDKLNLYTTIEISEKDKKDICRCLTDTNINKDRSIENFKEGNRE